MWKIQAGTLIADVICGVVVCAALFGATCAICALIAVAERL